MKKRGLSLMKVTIGLFLTVLTALSLTGCGGGGGHDDSTPPTPPTSINSIMGIGVIAQGKGGAVNSIAPNAVGISSTSPNWKRLDVPLVNQSGQTSQSDKLLASRVNSIAVTGDNVYSYIYLSWNAVSGANSYQVLYNGNTVWASGDSHPNDPKDGSTIAYLDLDDELAGKITAAGSYQFQVKALNSGASVIAAGTLTVSLGVKLGDYPKNISYVSGTHQLSWTGVSGANGYRVKLYSDAGYKNLSHDSGAKPLLTGASYDLTGKVSSGFYYGTIDAWATDANGSPLEIARGISGLTY
jgi:hypothetical protein